MSGEQGPSKKRKRNKKKSKYIIFNSPKKKHVLVLHLKIFNRELKKLQKQSFIQNSISKDVDIELMNIERSFDPMARVLEVIFKIREFNNNVNE